MANTLTFNSRVTGGGRLLDGTTGAQQPAIIGQTGGIIPATGLTLTNGTGNQQANQWYLATRTVAATTHDDLDLSGSLTNALGQSVVLTHVKYILLVVNSPDGTKKLRLGPQAVTNPFIGPWSGGQGATVYQDVYEVAEHRNTFTGWTVTAATGDVLGIYNPGAGSVTYTIFIMGY